MSTIFGFSLENELYYDGSSLPFSVTQGVGMTLSFSCSFVSFFFGLQYFSGYRRWKFLRYVYIKIIQFLVSKFFVYRYE